MSGQLLRFGCVGVVTTTLGLVIILALRLLGFALGSATAIGYGVGAVLGWVLNRGWSFRVEGNAIADAAGYSAVMAGSVAVNTLLTRHFE